MPNNKLLIVDENENVYQIGAEDKSSDHTLLNGRYEPDQHPIGAIAGLQNKLNDIHTQHNDLGGREEQNAHSIDSVTNLTDSLGDRIRWNNQKLARRIDIDTNSTVDPSKPKGLLNPYLTWGTYRESTDYGSNKYINVAPGSNLQYEDINVDSVSNVVIESVSTPDATVATLGSLSITGSTDNFAMRGIDIYDNLTIASSGADISFENSWIGGAITANAMSEEEEMLRAFYHCTIESDITLSGEGYALYYFENCWAGEGETHKPEITINNPNARLQLINCEGFVINRMQGEVELRGETIIYGYHSANTDGANWFGNASKCINPSTKELAPIVCEGTADINVECSTYARAGSNRAGRWIQGGIGVEQVRSNVNFVNFNAILTNSDGSERTNPNTQKDINAGIDYKFGQIDAQLAGANFTIQDSPDGTKIQFIDNGDQHVIYEFMKPQAIQGSDSISVAGGIASAILDENSSITAAIGAAVAPYVLQETGKQLSPEQYTADEKTKLGSQVPITAIQNANNLVLDGSTLKVTTQRINVLDYVALTDKTGSWDITWDGAVPAQVDAANALFPSTKLATAEDLLASIPILGVVRMDSANVYVKAQTKDFPAGTTLVISHQFIGSGTGTETSLAFTRNTTNTNSATMIGGIVASRWMAQLSGQVVLKNALAKGSEILIGVTDIGQSGSTNAVSRSIALGV